MTQDNIDRLHEIKGEIEDLLSEARRLLRTERDVYERARSYWLVHIETALSNDHEYLGGSMVTMQDTIQELELADICVNCGETTCDCKS